MSDDAILEVENIGKIYSLKDKTLFHALTNISFSLKRGESLGIIGTNGSGKSTLLKILSGVIKPSSGFVKVHGSVSSILDLGFGILPELTGRENIYLMAKLDGLSSETIKSKINEIIEFADIGNFIEEPVKNYSNGMYLRLAFAIKTVIIPDILILDEVVAVGDIVFQEKCKIRLDELKEIGTSIIMVSHSLEEMMKGCTSVLNLEKGYIKYFGATYDVVKKYNQVIEVKDTSYRFPALSEDPKIILTRIRANFFEDTDNRILRYSESLIIKFNLSVLAEDQNCDIILFLSDLTSMVMSDSYMYRKSSTYKIDQIGNYEIEVSFPSNLFNQGTYFLTILVGSRPEKRTLIRAEKCLKFEIVFDDYEKDKIWNNNGDYFPIRMPLKWIINQTS